MVWISLFNEISAIELELIHESHRIPLTKPLPFDTKLS